MACLRTTLTTLLISACVLSPLVSVNEASAIDIPQGDGDIQLPPVGTGGSPGVAEPPLMVYLTRYTYYVGEVITGQLDCPSCYPEGPTFFDGAGMMIAGTIVYDELYYGSFVFIPNEPLAVGLYTAQLSYAAADFEVVEGPALLPSYSARLIEDPHPVGEPLACQSYVPGYETYAYFQTRIDAGLAISITGESYDQYRYEFSIDEGETRASTSSGFPLASFREGHGEFCVEVFATPYNGDPELSLGTTCLDPDSELELGVQDLLYGTVESVLRVCELPPDGYTEEWCTHHEEAFVRHSCQGFVLEACLRARYDCPEGDLPEFYDENGIDPNDPNAPFGPSGGTGGMGAGGTGSGASSNGDGGGETPEDASGDESSAEAGGCGCRLSSSRQVGSDGGALLLVGLGGALIALRRRERKLTT